jgi:hypothetical protein
MSQMHPKEEMSKQSDYVLNAATTAISVSYDYSRVRLRTWRCETERLQCPVDSDLLVLNGPLN